ncbi:MAG TPA: hypothetical protein VFF31_08630, partial [Blastocatellia bacterium]|nr:hypothetical protein [Blastocatellia bacterium]
AERLPYQQSNNSRAEKDSDKILDIFHFCLLTSVIFERYHTLSAPCSKAMVHDRSSSIILGRMRCESSISHMPLAR